MRIAPVAELKARLSSYIRKSEEGPIIVTRNGKPVAVLISVDNEDELERLVLAYSPRFQKILNVSKQQIRRGEGIHHEDLWQEVEGEDT